MEKPEIEKKGRKDERKRYELTKIIIKLIFFYKKKNGGCGLNEKRFLLY